jgi:hypothetical protein
MDGKFIPCAKMFLLPLRRDPIEGLFFTQDLKNSIWSACQFGGCTQVVVLK